MPAQPLRHETPPELPDPLPPNRRPRLLITAAQLGLPDYRREKDLPRLLRGMTGETLPALERLEGEAEELRRAGDARWSATRHVDLMIALLAERQLRGL